MRSKVAVALFVLACSDRNFQSDGGDAASDGGEKDAPAFGDVVVSDVDQPGASEVFAHSQDTLYRLDPKTQAITAVGTFSGCSAVEDIALDQTSSMFATTLAILTLGFASAAFADVPNPKVTGPVKVGAAPGDKSHDYPWMATIQPGGLAPQKAPRIQAILRAVAERSPDWDLSFLRDLPLEEARGWLRALARGRCHNDWKRRLRPAP